MSTSFKTIFNCITYAIFTSFLTSNVIFAADAKTKPNNLNLTNSDLNYLQKTLPKRHDGSLKSIPVPEPVNINEFVKDKAAAIQLGKALFWDIQLGSDGATACGTCHFHAGADDRSKNSIAPGPSKAFTVPGPNGVMTADNFPITKFSLADHPGFELDPTNPFVKNSDNRFSSQGVRNYNFNGIIPNNPFERAKLVLDEIFNVAGDNVRRVEPRNTPTIINAVFNFSNFWDGRARNIFNGVNPFGELDEQAKVFVDDEGTLKAVQVRIPDASLASQAVGPPLSDFEMSSRGRTFPEIARKLLPVKALAYQKVHPNDSVLGSMVDQKKGLTKTYEKMIQAAFLEKWWQNSNKKIKFQPNTKRMHFGDKNEPRTFALDAGRPNIMDWKKKSHLGQDEYTQMEANFSLFMGLAVQLYEATLVSDDSKWDRVQAGQAQFTEEEALGQTAFGQGRCGGCHLAPEFTAHSVRNVRNGITPVAPGYLPAHAFDTRNTGNRQAITVDTGFLNLGVRPAGSVDPDFPGFVANTEDVGHGGLSPIMNPLTGEPYPLSVFRLAELKKKNLLPPGVAMYVPDLPASVVLPSGQAEAVDGTQKAPSLRNVELLGPYFHNGEASTVEQVIEFYTRGGNFPVTNIFNRDSGIRPVVAFVDNPTTRKNLVKFLLTLTDERVRNEQAPFDHPEIPVPSGSPGDSVKLDCKGSQPTPGINKSYCDSIINIPAVGADGRAAEGLPPLQTFLNLDPESP